MVLTSRLTKHNLLAAIWLPIVCGVFLLVQIMTSGHAHNENLDKAPEASCAICVQGSQSDDFDLPTPVVMPPNVVSESWTALVVKRQPVISALEAKARAPPYS